MEMNEPTKQNPFKHKTNWHRPSDYQSSWVS